MKEDDENAIPENNPDKDNENNLSEEFEEKQDDSKKEEKIDEEKNSSSVNTKAKKIEDSYFAGRDINIKIDKSEKPNGLPKRINDLGALKYNVRKETIAVKKLLIKNQFLVLNCASNDIAVNIAHSVAKLDAFKSYNKYECLFDRYEKSSQLVNLLEDCQKHVFKDDENQLLFIYDSQNNETPKLLESLTRENDLGKNEILNELNHKTYIVYFSYHQDLNYLKYSHFDFHYIDAFNIYAKFRSFSEELIILLRQQQKDNLWGCDRELLIDLDKHNDNQLKKIIQSKQNEEKTDFKTILRNKAQPVARYALFVATFFPKSNPGVFRKYVEILLQKKEIFINENKTSLLQIWNDDVDDILYECRLETYRKNKQYLIDFPSSTEASQCEEILYNRYTSFIDQQARVLIKKQGLFVNNTSRHSHFIIYPIIAKLTVSYRDYYGNELLKEWLNELEIQRKKLADLKNSFDTLRTYIKWINLKVKEFENIQSSEDSLEYLKQVSPRYLKPQYEVLLGEFQKAKFLFYKEENISKNTSLRDVIQELKEKNIFLEEEKERIAFDKNRLSQKLNKNIYLFVHLLHTIHEKDDSQEIIPDFFSNNFQAIYENYIVVDILNGFQKKNPNYNLLEHYKYALEHKEKKINIYTFYAFNIFLLEQPSMFYNFLKHIKNWLPKADEAKAFEHYSQTEKYTLIVLYTYFKTQMDWDRFHYDNENYSKSDTYIALLSNDENYDSSVDFILSHIFNPHLSDALHELFSTDFDDKQSTIRNVEQKQAKLVEYWFQLLKQAETYTKDEKINNKIKSLTKNIHKNLEKSQIRLLINQFNKTRKLYNEQISNTNANANDQFLTLKNLDYKKKRERIKTKRNNLAKLIKLLKH